MTSKKKEQRPPAPKLPEPPVFSLISNQKLFELYAGMLKCRLLKSALLERQPQWSGLKEIAPGQEAAAVGVATDLVADDTVAVSDSDAAVRFLTGSALGTILSGFTASDETVALWLGRLNAALGAALTGKTKKNEKIAVVFFSRTIGTPDAWPACWVDAVRVAASNDLPMVLVSHTDPVLEPAAQRHAKKVSRKQVQASVLDRYEFGLPVIPVDGDDAVAVYRVASESIARARAGRGPTLIDCNRSADGDSILTMETYLTRKGLFREELKMEIAAEFGRELEEAFSKGK